MSDETTASTTATKGGEVNGTISGDCGGKMKGSFDGQNNGVISGTLAGSCNVFFVNVPVKGTFSATVNKDTKAVPLQFAGGGGGFEHSDSMGLAY